MNKTPWPTDLITDENTGETHQAIAPYIISASRATDIPALYGKRFLEAFERGYVRWINPFSGKVQYVSLRQCRAVVFWTKNPAPFLPCLKELDRRGLNYYFQITLNDYEPERFEPALPFLKERIESLLELSGRIGRDRVLWRFDPLILTADIEVQTLLGRIERIGERIAEAVCRLTVSFLSLYPSVVRRMRHAGIDFHEPSPQQIRQTGEGLSGFASRRNLPVFTCAESRSLSQYGIEAASCIDPIHIARTFPDDEILVNFIKDKTGNTLFDDPSKIRRRLKDPGQRPLCGCMVAKDIGRYGTCSHGCIYCYAQGGRTRDIP